MNQFSRMKVLLLVAVGFIFLGAQKAQACAICEPPGPNGHCVFAASTGCQRGLLSCTTTDHCISSVQAAATGSQPATVEAEACANRVQLLAEIPRPTLRVVRADRLPART